MLKTNENKVLGVWSFYRHYNSYSSNITLYGKRPVSNVYDSSSMSPNNLTFYERGDLLIAHYGGSNMTLETYNSDQHRVFSLDFRDGLTPYNKMKWNIQGLPLSRDGLSPGDIYIDNNGFLKVVPYI